MSRFTPVPVNEVTNEMIHCTLHNSIEANIRSNDGKTVFLRYRGNKPRCLYGRDELSETQMVEKTQEGGECYIPYEPTNEELQPYNDDQLSFFGYTSSEIASIRNAT
jgi:hypothetical protein